MISEPSGLQVLNPFTPALEAALITNRARFLSFLRRRVGPYDAEEVLQSALVRVVERGVPAATVEGTVNWIYRVLQNAVIDHYRALSAEERGRERLAREQAEALVDPEDVTTSCTCLHDLLPEMKPEYAEMIRAVDIEERSVAEVARETGITANNASVRLHRARGELRKRLERKCGHCATHGCQDCACRSS